MHVRVILHSQFERIDVQRVRELVDGRLQGERSLGFPGCTHPAWCRNTQADLSGSRGYIGARVRVDRPGRNRIDQLVRHANRRRGGMFNGGELSISIGAERQLLNGIGPMADRGEHLGACQHQLHRSLRDPGGKCREHHMRPDAQPCAERAAHVRH